MRGLGRAIGALVWMVAASAAAAGTSVDSRDRRRTVDYEHLNLRSTFEYTDNSWLKHETHARRGSASAGGGPEGLNEEASLDGGNESAPTGDLSVAPVAGPAPVTLFEAAYGYDLRGNRLAKTVLVGSTPSSSYVPDEEDRLVSEMRGDMEITYAYSDRGEMISKTEGSVTTDFNTDYLGRIVGVNSLGKSWSYLFAPTGDRIAKYNNLATSENEWSLPDGGDTLADYHKTESAEEFSGLYVSPGVDGRVARIDSAGAPQYYFGDALQSVHQVTDASGVAIRTQFTDAWGNDIAGVGSGSSGNAGDRYGFTGRENDNESGLMHYRARSYDPMVGRFTSRDPVPYSNLYIYVQNDPVNMSDPSGREGIPDFHIPTWDEVSDRIRAGIAGGASQLQRTASQLRELQDALPLVPSIVAGKAADLAEIGASAASGDVSALAYKVWVPDLVKGKIAEVVERGKIFSDLRGEGRGVVESALITEATITEEGLGVGDMYDAVDRYKRGEIGFLHAVGKFQRGGEQFALTAASVAGALPEKAPIAATPEIELFHGTRCFQGETFDLAKVAKRPGQHLTCPEPAVFFTDDAARAIQQYGSGPNGTVIKVRAPRSLAETRMQQDIHGNVEYKFTNQEELDILNKTIEIKGTREAMEQFLRVPRTGDVGAQSR